MGHRQPHCHHPFLQRCSELLSEGYFGGTLNGLSVEQGYDNLLRRTSVATKQGAATLDSGLSVLDHSSGLELGTLA